MWLKPSPYAFAVSTRDFSRPIKVIVAVSSVRTSGQQTNDIYVYPSKLIKLVYYFGLRSNYIATDNAKIQGSDYFLQCLLDELRSTFTPLALDCKLFLRSTELLNRATF